MSPVPEGDYQHRNGSGKDPHVSNVHFLEGTFEYPPAAVHRTAFETTSPATSPGVAPRAIRTPISRVRSTTRKDQTVEADPGQRESHAL